MKESYSRILCAALSAQASDNDIIAADRPARYEHGDMLSYEIKGIFPAVEAHAELEINKFLGGGFAGQVYLCTLNKLTCANGEAIPGLDEGKHYAVKIMQPPANGSRRFRNFIYWLAFQGPFSAQVNEAASRTGVIWQKLFRKAAEIKFGRATAVKDVYASFWDNTLGAFGEITEWVEGRTWLLESDPHLSKRKYWRTIDLAETNSPEFIAKRRFMADFVELMHEMGAPEFARQYEWSTMKSQPNVMKRTDVDEPGPEVGLCAIDFRAGLALLPFLPMSPGDFKLIWQGLFKRKTLVQFDRCDLSKLDNFINKHPEAFEEDQLLIEELHLADQKYRRSLPDITHHGFRIFTDRKLRKDIRAGLVNGYRVNGLADTEFSEKLKASSGLFTLYYLTGAIPLLGRFLRKLMGLPIYRRHIKQIFSSWGYFIKTVEARSARKLIQWHRAGRTNELHTRYLAQHPFMFYLEKWTLGLLPVIGLHRAISEPSYIFKRIRDFFSFLIQFTKEEDFREQWFLEQISEGRKHGMLTDEEVEEITGHIHDPFIIKYLKCLGVHFATLPVTQVVAVIIGAFAMGWMLSNGHSWGKATLTFAGIIAFFQVIPISPGSICRGMFVVYLMIKERNYHDYLIAAPLSFVKYLGYLAFPLQMTTTYPQLARFMAGRWATSAVHIIPVFGERGALLEHWIYDMFFNVPQMFAIWAKPRVKLLLNIWLMLGVLLGSSAIALCHFPLNEKAAVNIIIATICIFVLPRTLFHPLLSRRQQTND